MAPGAPDAAWTEQALADLTNEFGEIYSGRTVLVTGADGFMGSHLTDALCHLGADVHAFVRATSSGALNNIGHLRDRMTRPLRRPDRQDFDRLPDPRPRRDEAVRLPPRRAGPRRRVVAPPLRDRDGEHGRDAEPAPVDRRPGPRDREVRHRGHLRGVRQPARVGRPPPRLRRAGQPDPPRALADQPEVGVRDREGGRRLPDDELLRRVRRCPASSRACSTTTGRGRTRATSPGRSSPRRSSAGDRARPARPAPRLLLLHRRRPRPPDRRREGRSRATSTCTARARTSRWRTGRRRSSTSARRTASGPPDGTWSRPRRATARAPPR